MNRIVILTAGFGEGHNAAARALAQGFERQDPPEAPVVVDVFALSSPGFDRIARTLYLKLINHAPRVWSRIYSWIDRTRFIQHRLWIFRREIKVLAALLRQKRPVAVCCTYPLYAFFLEQIAREGGPTPLVFNIVTDSISIHSLWWRARCDGWFLPNEDSAAVLRDAGVSPASLQICGFPVPAFFGENAALLSPPVPAGGVSPRVLHIINSGTRGAEETARRLLLHTPWDITCAVGRDKALQIRLEKIAAVRGHPTRILGWTNQMPRLLMTHHLVVSKAGGATTQEAIAALCPMIICQVVPGQEEGNYELLRRHQAGALATSPADVVAQLNRALADDGALWRRWRAALRPLARPDAAGDIARSVLAAVARCERKPDLTRNGRIRDPLSTALPHSS